MGAELDDFFGVMDAMLLDYGAELTAPRLSLEFNIGAALASKLLRLYIRDKVKQRKAAASEKRVRLLLKFAAALGDRPAKKGSASAVLCDLADEPFSAKCPPEPWCLYSVVRLPPASADGLPPPSSTHAQWQEEVRSLLPHFACGSAAASSGSEAVSSVDPSTEQAALYIPPFAAIRQSRLVGRKHRCSGVPSPAGVSAPVPARQPQTPSAAPSSSKTLSSLKAAGNPSVSPAPVLGGAAEKGTPEAASKRKSREEPVEPFQAPKASAAQSAGDRPTGERENKAAREHGGKKTQSPNSLLARFGFGTHQKKTQSETPSPRAETSAGELAAATKTEQRRETGESATGEAREEEMDARSWDRQRKRPLDEGEGPETRAAARAEDENYRARPAKKAKQVSDEEGRMQRGTQSEDGVKACDASAGGLFADGEGEEDREREYSPAGDAQPEDESNSEGAQRGGVLGWGGHGEEERANFRGRGNKAAKPLGVQMECEEKTIVLKEKAVETRTYREGDYLVLQDEDVVKDKEVTVRTLRPSSAPRESGGVSSGSSRASRGASGSEASDSSKTGKRGFGAGGPKKKQGSLMAFFQRK
nr:TPA: hypothetical protein BN1204_056220 [Neospora caninum Liverpool]